MEKFNSADILKKQNRKKRLVFMEFGMFEISFVLIIIILLFGALNYFNILSLSSLYPNQFGFLPHRPFNAIPPPTNQLTNSSSPAIQIQAIDVSAASEVPEYSLEIIDKNALISYIKSFRLWGRIYNEKANETILRKIVFRLSDTEGRISQLVKKPDGSPMFSSEYFSTKDTIEIDIYISPEDLASANRSDIFDKAAIANIHHLSLFTPVSEEIEAKDIMNLYEKKEKNNNHYFRIERK